VDEVVLLEGGQSLGGGGHGDAELLNEGAGGRHPVPRLQFTGADPPPDLGRDPLVGRDLLVHRIPSALGHCDRGSSALSRA
jgi:hypothetical protein